MASDTRLPLSVDLIAAAALEIIDERGLDGFTMRGLGDRLGYEAMAIYKHLADKNAVLDAAVASVYAAMVPASATSSWSDQLHHIARELRRAAITHPHLFQRLVTRPPADAAVSKRIDSTLGAIRAVRDDEAFVARHFWLFIGYTTGALLAETTSLIAPEDLVGAVAAEGAEDLLVQCPALSEFGPALADCDFATEYERGVATVLASIAHAGGVTLNTK